MVDVKSIRAALGLTQAQFADQVGVDQSTVSNWEKGKRPSGPARRLLQDLVERSFGNAARGVNKQEPAP